MEDGTMTPRLHPAAVLFAGEKPLPAMPAVDHYAGSEKLMVKALQLQQQLGPIFDITLDCEDGARAGDEEAHAKLCVDVVRSADNRFGRVAARVHDGSHAHWHQDLEILVQGAGDRLAFITFPKVQSAADLARQIGALRQIEKAAGSPRPLPVHVLIETHGALREVTAIATLDGVESIDFGLMDFVSAHHGAIPAAAMVSPGQFDHPLVRRAKCEIAAAALAQGIIPTHSVTTEFRDLSQVRDDARRAREEFGFLRMWSIHPAQIEPIAEAMRPSFGEVEIAVEILILGQEAQWGPTSLAGKLHDRASYRYYWELLARAHATGMSLPGPALERFFH